MAVQFWFEFGSTYSYPAALRVEEVARARGVALQWRAFLLGPIFRAQGWNDSPFNLYAAKGRYMWRDLERLCEQLAIPFRRPSQFPRNGLLAARVAAWFADEAWLPSFVRAVYRANFADDRDIADRAVVAECLQAAGQEPAPALDAASAEPAKERLRARTEEAGRLGIFGAPTCVVGGELFWGQDRLEAALDADRAARASAPGEVQGDLAVEVESIPLQSDPMERRREIETRGAASDSDEIWRGLALYNLAAWGELFTPLRVFLRDARGCIHGGLLGDTGGEVLFVAQLWVAEALRRRGLGRSLLRAAEQEALRRGCRVAHLDTFDFQAPEFYAGLGYRPFGRLEGYRGGRVRHYLRKALA